MKIKKILGCFLAGVMTVGTMSAVVGAEEYREYRCKWLDVRPDCDYDLTVEKIEIDGEKKCIVKVAGIPEKMVNGSYDRFAGDENKSIEVSFKNFALNIDVNDGRNYFYIRFNKAGEKANCFLADALGPFGPDQEGKYCYYQDYMVGKEYADTGNYECIDAEFYKDDNGKFTLEFCIDENNEHAQMLLECQTTTVMTYGELFVDSISNGNGSGGKVYFGYLSDGTMIAGDGKYIDCCTGENLQRRYDSLAEMLGLRELCVDGVSDLPKETVEVKIIDSEEPFPDDTTSENTTPENTIVTSESATSAPETSSENEATAPVEPNTELTDKDSGITVGGNSIGDLQLKVEKGESDGKSAHLDISLLDKNGKAVQPNGTVTVKIPVPESFKGEDCKVYREESDGSYTDMKAKLENGYLVFDTDHFSKYVVTTEALSDDKDNNKPTGTVIAFIPAFLAAAGVLCFKKRK